MSNAEPTTLEPLPQTPTAEALTNPIQYPPEPPAKAAKKTPPKMVMRTNKDGSLTATETREMTIAPNSENKNVGQSILDILSGNLSGLNEKDRAKATDAAHWLETAAGDAQNANWRITVLRKAPLMWKKKQLDTTSPACEFPICNFAQLIENVKLVCGGGRYTFQVFNAAGTFQHGADFQISTTSNPPKFPESEDDDEGEEELSDVQKAEQAIALEEKRAQLEETRARNEEARKQRELRNMPPPPPAPVDNTQLLLAGMEKMMTMVMTGLERVVTNLKPSEPPKDNMPLIVELLSSARRDSTEASKAQADANARAEEAKAKAAVETARLQAESAERIAKYQVEQAKLANDQAKEMREMERKNSDKITDLLMKQLEAKNTNKDSVKEAFEYIEKGRKQAMELLDRDGDSGGGFWEKAGDVLLGGIRTLAENPEAAGAIAALLQRPAPAQGERFSDEELKRAQAIIRQNQQRQLPNHAVPQLSHAPAPINPAQFTQPAPVEPVVRLNGHDEFTGGLDESEMDPEIQTPPAQEMTGDIKSVVTRVLMVACDEMKAHKAQHAWPDMALQYWGQFISQLEQAGEDRWFELIQANCDPRVYARLGELMYEGDCSDGQRFTAALKQMLTPQ